MSRMSRLLRPFVVTLLVFAMQPAFAHPAPDGFADLAARLLPGVVNISSSQTVSARGERGPEIPVFPPGSPFEQFFKDFMEQLTREHGIPVFQTLRSLIRFIPKLPQQVLIPSTF